ncbi:MAG: helix-turn-helix domain-containing protein [Nanoarchaeota archaeon]|nr:helix-turn-helix domain-containing protein [Nanoarchaeota archaeon]
MEEELKEYGLTEKEAKLFLVCLKTGEATANRLTELIDLPRSTVYDLLQKLLNQGLISTIIKGSKTHFIANNPKVLLKSLDDKRYKIERIIPQLLNMQNQIHEKPIAEIYEGRKGVIFALDSILNNARYIKLIGSRKNAIKVIEYHPDNFIAKRIEKKIQIKQILEESAEARKLKSLKYSKVKYLESIKNSKNVIFLYNDTVVNLILGSELSVIKIQSKEYADSQERLFDEMWKIAKD